ncbi:HDOD domain-containing protein [Desulfurobacterium thermolithotrophum]|uniref:HDOD domain-containing protein n=1 Tax=Desulfurobacterium thermolithotrophum TaxID=64160 RepID=UPI0013D67ED4|nr:HDOD domain-containing protein [Desulfurobacterium thermolithotrophum]
MADIERLELNREVMLRLIKALIDGEELEEIANIISMDPNLSAKLLKFINSPYFGLRKEIKSIIQAIAYLGYNNLKDYVFVLLTSSLLKNKSKEEIKKVLKFAYLLRALAEKILPEHADEAYMVGIFEPVKQEVGEKTIKEILEKAGISEHVILGLSDSESELGKLKKLAKQLIDLCGSIITGENIELPNPLSELDREELIQICLESENKAHALVSTL